MEGRISVTLREGEGSTFLVELPVLSARKPSGEAAVAQPV
jgi:hypothetical protein